MRLRALLSPTGAGAARSVRSAWSTQSEPLLAGCGFALALGWLWFAGLGELWREGTAEFLDIRAHEGLLAFSFGAGCLVFGFAAGFVRRKGLGLISLLDGALGSVLTHGGALLCLGLLCAADVPPATGVALAGLAEAALGVYWLSRILVLDAARAVAALAWASLASLLVAGLTLVPSPGGDIVPVLAGCVLFAWLLAFVLNMRSEAPARLAEHVAGQAGESIWKKRESALIVALGLAFFILGAMYALPMDYRLADPGAGGPFALPVRLLAAHLAGAVLAVPVLYPVFRASSSNFLIFTDNGLRFVLFASIGALCFAGFCPFFFPSFAPLALEPASAFLEAAGLGTFAALVHRSGVAASYTQRVQAGDIPRLAGIFLAALSLTVNAGHAAGRGIIQAHGTWGTAFFLAALILLLALVFVSMAAKRRSMAAESVPEVPAKLQERREAFAPRGLGGAVPPAPPVRIREEIAASFNTKEQAVAALLVQGHTNKKIAEYLSVTENAVRWHIKNLNKKTGATDRRQLLDILTKDAEGFRPSRT